MKKKFCAVFLVFMSGVILAAAGPLRVAFSSESTPLSWGEDGALKGILVDAASEAFRRMGVKVEMNGYPWMRAQKMVKDGDADAFITILTPERRQFVSSGSEPLISLRMGMVAKRGSAVNAKLAAVRTAEDLRAFSVLSYRGNGWSQSFLKGITVDWALTTDQCLKKLARGRADVYVSDLDTVGYRIKKLGLENELVVLPNVLDRREFRLGIRKQSEHLPLLPRFDQTIRQMKADGSLQRILEKYSHADE